MAAPVALSVLDLVPVRSGQSSAQALDAARTLVRLAERAGCRRYWVAEHHNAQAVASTSPPVIIGILAAETTRIRVGSGGVMLPNHAPLAVAEQFAVLQAAFPGRIDLGIGRAPGTDPVTSWALRAGGGTGSGEGDPVAHFPAYVEQVAAFMNPGGAAVRIAGRPFTISATPNATTAAPVWLLGSSNYSARLAGQLGLPYVFAHHFSGRGTAEALALYRDSFAGTGTDQPRTFLTANAVVADTQQEADRLALPFQHMMAGLRVNAPQRPLLTVEEATTTAAPVPPDVFAAVRSSWFVGTADEVADGIRRLAQRFDVEEVMIQPVAGSYADDPPDRAPAREHTVTALAERLN